MANRIAGNHLAQRIEAARKSAGLSVLQLSEKTGIPNSTLSRKLKHSPGRLTLEDLSLIADATQVDLWDLLGASDEQQEAAA